jgi:hypothetical protein
MSKTLRTLTTAVLLAACGAPAAEPAAEPEAATAGGETDPNAQLVEAARHENPQAFEGGAAPGTRAALEEMQAVVMAAYPGPFDQTFATLTSRYGEPARSEENMFKWFARDGETCLYLFVTQSQGHAAAGIAEAEASDCP